MLKRGICVMMALVLLVGAVVLAGCSTPEICEARLCDRAARNKCYNVGNPEEAIYFCKNDLPSCDVCVFKDLTAPSKDAVKYYEVQATGYNLYFCESCELWELDRYVNVGDDGVKININVG